MGGFKRAVLVAALMVTGAATACTTVEVNVLPFDVTNDFTKRHAELVELGAGGEVGMVRTVSTVKVDECSVTVGYVKPVLYVARELKANRCAFDHVLQHEEEHVRIYRDGLAGMAERVRALVSEGKSPMEAAQAALQEVRARHALHDSPEEYELNRTACRGQIIRLAMNG